MADNVKQKAHDFEKELYPNADFIAKWHSVCEQNHYDKTIEYAMELISALNAGEPLESVRQMYDEQIYSGKGGLRTLNIVAQFTKGEDCRGIELFKLAEPEYTSGTFVAKKLALYQAQIEILDFRQSVPRKNLDAFDEYFRACRDKHSDLYGMGYMLKAVDLMKAVKSGKSLEKIKLGESLHDVAIAKIIFDIGGNGAIGSIVAKGGMSRDIATKAIKLAKTSDSSRTR